MPIDLTRPAPPIVMAGYPGMAKAEQRIWDRFLTSSNNFYTGFLYNVRVGELPQLPEGTEENLRAMWEQINQSRLDALGIAEEVLTVFEVKVSAGLSAIGQAIGGRILTEAETDDARPIEAAIVSNGIRPDVITVARALGMETFII